MQPDLQGDRFYRWLTVWHWLPITLTGVVLLGGGAAIGGWKLGLPWLLWGVLLRVTVGFHVTWLVNSATHLWGTRRFHTHDDSTNNWWVALLTGGEGWHNNHHAHPVSATHGMAWWEVDFNYRLICMLAMLGLAKDIKVTDLNSARIANGANQRLSGSSLPAAIPASKEPTAPPEQKRHSIGFTTHLNSH